MMVEYDLVEVKCFYDGAQLKQEIREKLASKFQEEGMELTKENIESAEIVISDSVYRQLVFFEDHHGFYQQHVNEVDSSLDKAFVIDVGSGKPLKFSYKHDL